MQLLCFCGPRATFDTRQKARTEADWKCRNGLAASSSLQQRPAAGFWHLQRMGLRRLHACVIGHTDRCVLLTVNDVPTIPTFSGYPLLPVSFHLSSTTMHFPMAVILPASQSGPRLHGDGVSKPLPGTSTLEIYCFFLGFLPSLALCRCQCVVH